MKFPAIHSNDIILFMLRVVTGSFLIIKGAEFLANKHEIEFALQMLSSGPLKVLIFYIAWIHIVGGVLVACGLLTRLSFWVQMPIVLGACYINFTSIMVISNLIQALALGALAVFLIIRGPGRYSLDFYLEFVTAR